MELAHEEVVKTLKKKHDEEITQLRQDFEGQSEGKVEVMVMKRKLPCIASVG